MYYQVNHFRDCTVGAFTKYSDMLIECFTFLWMLEVSQNYFRNSWRLVHPADPANRGLHLKVGIYLCSKTQMILL